MPAVSDPGSRLVLAAAAAGVVVEVIPGPSAVTAAFAASGIEGDGFAFIGFLPRTAGGLNARLDAADAWGLPLIAFEAPGRLPRTLATLAAREPERRIVVCRELTKLHEQVARGTVAELAAQFREPPPGEVTLVLAAGAPPQPAARRRSSCTTHWSSCATPASVPAARRRSLRSSGASPTRAVRAPDRRHAVASLRRQGRLASNCTERTVQLVSPHPHPQSRLQHIEPAGTMRA